jgi:hypothetical protein
MWSLSRTSEGDGRLAVNVSSSTEGRRVIGYITKNYDETWSIEGDGTLRKFRGAEEAIMTFINEAESADTARTQAAKTMEKAKAATENG